MSGKSGCEYIKCEYVRRDTGGVRCTHPGGICIYRDEADTIARLKAENAALREEAALYQKEWAILRAEVERFRAENAQLKCNFAPILHFAKQEQEKRGEPSVVIDSEGIPIENAVLRRNYITLRSQLEQAEGELAECRGKVEKVDNEICGLLEYFDCIEEGDQTEEERNFVADLTRMQKILERK